MITYGQGVLRFVITREFNKKCSLWSLAGKGAFGSRQVDYVPFLPSCSHQYVKRRFVSNNIINPAGEGQVLYAESHEYLRFLTSDGPEAAAGISEFAAEELGEVVFIESVVSVGEGKGARVARGDPVCTLEAVKSVAEVYAPVAGRILEFNEKVKEDPGLINRDPEGEGWIFSMAVDTEQNSTKELTEQSPQAAARSILLSPAAYAAHVRREGGGGTEN